MCASSLHIRPSKWSRAAALNLKHEDAFQIAGDSLAKIARAGKNDPFQRTKIQNVVPKGKSGIRLARHLLGLCSNALGRTEQKNLEPSPRVAFSVSRQPLLLAEVLSCRWMPPSDRLPSSMDGGVKDNLISRRRPNKSVAMKSRPDKTLFALAWRDRTAMVAVHPELSRKLKRAENQVGGRGKPRGRGREGR